MLKKENNETIDEITVKMGENIQLHEKKLNKWLY